ncbi:hypothetical protein LTR05_003230 [Lithohypha guttulata]|uniref:Zinc finger Mcm10/DnaG-type domain-containing protein n=1 Tax=Lithohypha guttulata TaxID=1690604 RepID=A0AAN7T3H7_9EURO|nr:hypothetical protein LTR05_003230 [Lithohypha guttulata]
MAVAEQWPPRSPMKALLSSPSGRKRYREYQNLPQPSSSPKKLLGSPSLLEKLRATKVDRDHEFLQPQKGQIEEDDEDEDEDEETLRLKLDAIEAKLKLKKLQQQKAKGVENIRPEDSRSTVTTSSITGPNVEVALSPTKRTAVPFLPKSPSRIRLGIDKGVSAGDVSLKRAKTINTSPAKQRLHHVDGRPSKQSSSHVQSSTTRPAGAPSAHPKSFSDRMAEMRNRERSRDQKSSAMRDARASRFNVDKTELASYHAASEAASKVGDPTQNIERDEQPSHSQQTPPPPSRSIEHSHSMPTLRSSSLAKTTSQLPPSTNSSPAQNANRKGDPALFEDFSGTHLATRILPHTFLRRTLPTDQFTIYRMPKLLKDVTSPDYQMPDEVTDYVVFGIIAHMSLPRNHKARQADKNTVSSAEWEKKWKDGSTNNQKFLVVTLTDLKWSVELFLFDTAVPRYHRLTPGTLIAILNPGIMPPKKGLEDTGAFSLTLHDGEDQILEIGKAKHFGYCKAVKKDGHKCPQWVNVSKTHYCEFHINAQINRTRSSRSGINSMNAWQPDKPPQKQSQNRKGFDHESQSFYYSVGGVKPQKQKEDRWSFAPTANSSLSTAKLLDASNLDDPYLAEGQMLERDQQDRLRKRMADMAREHEIVKKLGAFTGSAGGQYMKQRTDETDISRSGPTSKPKENPGSGITKDDILVGRPGQTTSKKRTAESVRLSPVKKKTRFLTETGIKEAGRESLGPSAGFDDEDDDDDLEVI